jgi:hypothetical protein
MVHDNVAAEAYVKFLLLFLPLLCIRYSLIN